MKGLRRFAFYLLSGVASLVLYGVTAWGAYRIVKGFFPGLAFDHWSWITVPATFALWAFFCVGLLRLGRKHEKGPVLRAVYAPFRWLAPPDLRAEVFGEDR